MLVQGTAIGLLHCCDYVISGDRSEQLASLGGANLDGYTGEVFQLLLDFACVIQIADLACFLSALDAFDLLLCTAGCQDGVAARQQVITSVACLLYTSDAADDAPRV